VIDKALTNPGYHKQFLLKRFNADQRAILDRLKENWYLTSAGETISIAQSSYDYFLMKPTARTTEMFNIEREIVCVFSDYDNFETRSLDAFDHAARRLTKLRAESVCCVLIARFPGVEGKVDALLKSDPEHPIVVPFTYAELKNKDADSVVVQRFRSHFYTRDLFAFLSPLKKDTYFFGRSNLINEIVNQYKSGEHASLFGLRKSGKTSIVYAIQRRLEADEGSVISIDCESPAVHKLSWFELLQKIVGMYREARGSKAKIDSAPYDDKTGAERFEREMSALFSSRKASSTLIIFDEIERLTPGTASSPHWREGSDFIYFWQTMRAFYQMHPGVFSYMVVGTNPNCIEAPSLVGHENPIYASIKSQYVPPFSVSQVREMVSKLGDYMGLKFEESLYAMLTNDLGGHPFLIRQMCSFLHSKAVSARPVQITRAFYTKHREEFTLRAADHLDMMVHVLRDWYPDEYEMLRMLACGETEQFAAWADDSPALTRHLLGYGLIEGGSGSYCLTLDSLGDLMKKRHVFQRMNLSIEEKVAEVSLRRNRVEKALRQIVRLTLRAQKGEAKAAEMVLQSVPEKRRPGLVGLSTLELLNADSSPLFFLELVSVFKREWGSFVNVIQIDKDRFINALEDINRWRVDAHAKSIDEDDFAQVRLHFKRIEAVLAEAG
jgi:hypothetical protein